MILRAHCSTKALAIMLALLCPARFGAAAPDSEALTTDEWYLEIERTLPGFGGWFYDEQGRLTAYVEDPSAPSAVLVDQGVERLLRGDYSFSQLASWRDALTPLLALESAVLLDVDETRNRVRFGVDLQADQAVWSRLEASLAMSGVPRQAVLLEPTEPVRPVATLTEFVRPVPAGYQVATSQANCTLSFNAVRAGTFGVLTCSHCTFTQGGVESTIFHNEENDFTKRIATETVDPVYFTGAPCPVGRRCRRSDSAFGASEPGSSRICRSLARTLSRGTNTGSLTINDAQPRLVINGTTNAPVAGQQLNKIGRTTGWTFGNVTTTCANTNVSGTDITLLCQAFVTAGSDPGDSGSPVFAWTSESTTANLHGILWGESGSSFVFSPFGNVVAEIGGLPCQIALTGQGSSLAGKRVVSLSWTRAPATTVDIFRDGVKVGTASNNQLSGMGSWGQIYSSPATSANFWVCDAGSTTWYNSFTCSDVVTVTY